MALKLKRYVANVFKQGMNRNVPVRQIEDDELVTLINGVLSSPGVVRSRLGCSKYNASEVSSANRIPWAYRFYDKDRSTKASLLIANIDAADKMYIGNDSTGVLTEITGGTGFAANSTYNAVSWKDTVFVTNGTDPIQLWATGTNKADITGTPTPPTGRYIELHYERLWVAGNSSYPSRLYYCEVSDETAWPENNYLDIYTNDGGYIQGIAELGQILLVFKNNAVYKVYGNTANTFEVKPALGLPGLKAPGSLVKAVGGVVWLASEGVFYYDGANLHKLNSDKIEALIDDIDGSCLDEVSALFADEHYYLLYCDGSVAYNNSVLDYNFKVKAWGKFEGWNLSSMIVWDSGDDNGEIYGGSSNSGYFYRLFHTYADDGTDITVTIETKHVDGDEVFRIKSWKDIYINAFSGDADADVTVQPILDVYGYAPTSTLVVATTNLWGSITWGAFFWGGGGIKTQKFRLVSPGKSYSLGLRLTWASDASYFLFRGFEIDYYVLSRKR